MICRLLPFRRMLRLRSKCSVIVAVNFVCMFVIYSFTLNDYSFTNESRQQKFEQLGHIDPRTYSRVRIDLGPLMNKTVPLADTFDYGPCEGLKIPPPIDLKETHQFLKVHPLSQETMVYSAFYDPRLNPSAIRIVGISSGESSLSQVGIKKYCQIWYVDRTQPEISSAEYQIIPETHERKYAISVHLCYLRRHPTIVPYAVSLVMKKCDEAYHVLKVNSYSYSEPPERNYTVCVTPLNMNYNKINEFVDIIEANKLFGAQKFVFYNHSSAAELQPYLNSYIDEGIAEVYPWKVPVPVDTWPPDPHVEPQIHYFAQLGALTDCLYRHMFSSKYILFSDLDELLVPQIESHFKWDDMWKNITVEPMVGEWIFQSAFFRMDWPDDNIGKKDPVVAELGLITQLKTLREFHSFPHFSRSKYILNPRLVDMIGVHYVFEFLDNSPMSQILVPDSVALLHHYRLWDDGDSAPSRTRSTVMHRYASKIKQAVQDRRERAKKYMYSGA